MTGARADCFVSVVAPLLNDAAIVRSFVDEVLAVLRRSYLNYELVLVDDGSHDDTAQVVDALLPTVECVRYLRLSRTFGEEIAISAGLDTAIGDYVVVLLPNTDPPALIPTFVDRVRANGGIAYGIRTNRVGEHFLIRLGARAWYWYAHRFLHLNLPRNSSQYRSMARQAVNAMVRIRDRNRYLRLLSTDVGYASVGIPYEQIQRNPRRPVRGFLERVNVTLDIIVTNTAHPLRIVTYIGLFASCFNALYVAYVVGIYIARDGRLAEGWATLSLQNSSMFFFTFLILTILSEYIGRILIEMRDRPLYNVMYEAESPVHIASEQRRNIVTTSVHE